MLSMQAYWCATQDLVAYNPCFRLPFAQALAWVRRAFKLVLRAADMSIEAGTLRGGHGKAHSADTNPGAATESSRGSIEGAGTAAPGAHARASAQGVAAKQRPRVAARKAGLEHRAEAFAKELNVQPRALHEALLDTAAMWLDRDAAALHAAVMSAHLRAAQGEFDANSVQLLLQLLSRGASACAIASSVLAGEHDATRSDVTSDRAHAVVEHHITPAALTGSPSRDTLSLWLDRIRLDTLAWLETQLPALAGLGQHVLQHRKDWFAIAAGRTPWESLPLPFRSAPALHKLLIVIALDAAHAHTALRWFSLVQPSAYGALGGHERVLCALLLLPSPPPALLHSSAASDPTGIVQMLASVQASGAASVAPTDNSALSGLSLRSGATPCNDVACSAPVTTMHLHSRVTRATVCKAVSTHATRRAWLLITCAHLRPDLVTAALQALAEVHQSGAAHAEFHLLFHCPTQALSEVPLRAQMQTVMLGGTYAVAPYVVQLCHAADMPAARALHLASREADARLSRLEQATFQKVALAILLAFATIAELATNATAGALPLAIARAPAVELRSVLRGLSVARKLLRGCESLRRVDFRQLCCAVFEVRSRAFATLQCSLHMQAASEHKHTF